MWKYIVLALLVVFLIYMIAWTFQLRMFNKRAKKVKRIK